MPSSTQNTLCSSACTRAHTCLSCLSPQFSYAFSASRSHSKDLLVEVARAGDFSYTLSRQAARISFAIDACAQEVRVFACVDALPLFFSSSSGRQESAASLHLFTSLPSDGGRPVSRNVTACEGSGRQYGKVRGALGRTRQPL